jgi:hypothetical protein
MRHFEIWEREVVSDSQRYWSDTHNMEMIVLMIMTGVVAGPA